MIEAKYAHTNLVARDWRALARFYVNVFGCVPVPPERELSGEWLARGTGLHGASLRGVHLRLPGYGDAGPTLEIFQYSELELAKGTAPNRAAPNRQGFGHVGFGVADVAAALAEVLSAGGERLGEVAYVEVDGAGSVRFVYVRDPEGNIIELQSWDRAGGH